MTIDVSDLGIVRSDSGSSQASKVKYVSMNERLNRNPIERIKRVGSFSEDSQASHVAERSRKSFVLDSTPAYTVEFTSAGKVALQTFKGMKKNLENESLKEASGQIAGYSRAKDGYDRLQGKKSDRRATDRKKTYFVKDSGNTGRTESQVMKNAISAYNVQMDFTSRKGRA